MEVYAYDQDGWYDRAVVLDDSDLSPLQPGVYLIPGNAATDAPPEHTGGRWPRFVGGGWTLANRDSGEAQDMPDATALRIDLLAALSEEYGRRMHVLADGYPLAERESWPVQTQEARALTADPATATPWIDAAALARGIDRVELAQRICAKDDAYRQIHGALTGTRQRIEDQIDAAGDDVEALSLIDVGAGWPLSPV